MDQVSEVVKVEGSNLHDCLEKFTSVCGHLDLEQGHHHDELLSVDHGPQLVERGRHENIEDHVGVDGDFRALSCCIDRILHFLLSASEWDLVWNLALQDNKVILVQADRLLKLSIAFPTSFFDW